MTEQQENRGAFNCMLAGGMVLVFFVTVGVLNAIRRPEVVDNATQSAQVNTESRTKVAMPQVRPIAKQAVRKKPPPNPELQRYCLQIAPKFNSMSQLMNQFNEVNREFIEMPSLLDDEGWRLRSAACCAGLNVEADALAQVPAAPPEARELNHICVEIASEVKLMTSNYASGIDTRNAAEFDEASKHITRFVALSTKGARLADELGRTYSDR